MSWILDKEVLAVLAAIILVSAVFAGVQVFNAGRVTEAFSELGLLGVQGKIGDYPRQVVAGQPFSLSLYVGNHEGKTMLYKVLFKAGDNSSTINETVPLSATPIMAVYVVLAHNASSVMPLNITLWNPGVNVRLVAEMWVYNITVDAFTYHGRWNQLWLNVSAPPTGVAAESPSGQGELSPQMEHSLIEGYLSLRRAEDAGGDVSEMNALLNSAVKLAVEGHMDMAEAAVRQAVAMEPEVARRGAEAASIRLYASIGALVAVAATGVALYLLLRRRVWVFWARLYRSWRLIWHGGSVKLSPVEKAIRDYVKSGGEVHVENLVYSPGLGYGAQEVAHALYRLVRNGALRLVDPSPPKSFLGYMFSKYNIGFAVATLLTVLCVVSVYASMFSPALAASRLVLGSLFTLFLPGYSLIEALYPREEELAPLERLALSIGLSLALVPLVGLALNYTPWGIRLDPIMAALSTLTLGLLLASAYRKYRLLALKAAA